MRKLFIPLIGAAALLTLAAGVASAVPCGPSTCAPFSVAPAGGNALLVRWQGATGPLSTYNLTTGKRMTGLPAGVLAANGRTFVSGSPDATSSGTTVTRYDARTGESLDTWTVAAAKARVAAVSVTGRYAALIAGEKNQTVTVADLDRQTVLRTVQLQGQWQVDALSRDASRLYLLEYQPNGSYRVRLETTGRGLVPEPVTDPDEKEPMTGSPWSSVATPDGRWQLTLFIKSSENKSEAFIHALSLDTAAAKCIDLSSGEFMSMGRYALVLSPNGRTLYAANPSIGRLSVVDLRRRAVTSTVRFPSIVADNQYSRAFGAVSRDGRNVYFSSGLGLQAYDTRTHAVRRVSFTGPIVGIGVAPSRRTLLAIRPTMATSRLDARSGRVLRA